MKARSLALSVALVLLVALLLTAPVAAKQADIPFTGHASTADYEYLTEGVWTQLPGGRILVTGLVMRTFFEADDVDPDDDYFTGYWLWDATMVVEPSGAAHAWGTSISEDLTIFPGQDTGGWVGEFSCQYAPDIEWGVVFRNTIQFGTGQGWGDLEGWSTEFRVRSRHSSELLYYGEFVPPQ
ncbi:MAG: hypothetical protein GX557_10615 [Chloroflexi bacterium]|nr:hypothetical protein [Chloroflexota bacterium]